jgi:hypothetical protein
MIFCGVSQFRTGDARQNQKRGEVNFEKLCKEAWDGQGGAVKSGKIVGQS